MRSIIFDFEDNNSQNLYIQIFDQIKARILSGEFEAGMKLPSLRGLAKANDRSYMMRRALSSPSGRSA